MISNSVWVINFSWGFVSTSFVVYPVKDSYHMNHADNAWYTTDLLTGAKQYAYFFCSL